MAVNESFTQYVKEQLEGMGEVKVRKMFGGAGVYMDGVIMGLIDGSTLFLKVNDSNRDMFEKKGMGPFKPYPDKNVSMSYYEVPAEVLEDREELKRWAAISHHIKKTA